MNSFTFCELVIVDNVFDYDTIIVRKILFRFNQLQTMHAAISANSDITYLYLFMAELLEKEFKVTNIPLSHKGIGSTDKKKLHDALLLAY
ncbi:hypothetical protein GCM10027288_24550 [Bordetella tumbae]